LPFLGLFNSRPNFFINGNFIQAWLFSKSDISTAITCLDRWTSRLDLPLRFPRRCLFDKSAAVVVKVSSAKSTAGKTGSAVVLGQMLRFQAGAKLRTN
jgi:hypothetical protein